MGKIVRMTIDENYQLSEESLARQAALKDRPIDYSDIPHLSSEDIREMRRMTEERRSKKKMFSMRLKVSTLNWWKSLGEGYTSIMSQFLDSAAEHPEWIKTCLK